MDRFRDDRTREDQAAEITRLFKEDQASGRPYRREPPRLGAGAAKSLSGTLRRIGRPRGAVHTGVDLVPPTVAGGPGVLDGDLYAIARDARGYAAEGPHARVHPAARACGE